MEQRDVTAWQAISSGSKMPPLPPREIRFGSVELQDDDRYLASAVEQVDHLRTAGVLEDGAVVIDFGCGQGRFAYGLLARMPGVAAYLGIETHQPSINWCINSISPADARFRFEHIASHNARYNPSAPLRPSLGLPPAEADLVFANSVVSHMLVEDVLHYAAELHAALRPGGAWYLTAFTESGVPDVEENPPGYLEEHGVSKGALHRVRYRDGYLFELLASAGFGLTEYRHRSEKRTGQSSLLVERLAR